MAYTFINNVAALLYDGSADAYAFLTAALAKGWTWVAGGDGLAVYSDSANFFIGSEDGANGLGNEKAWFAVQKPAGGAAPYDLPVIVCWQIGAGFGTETTRYVSRIVISRGASLDLTNADPDRCAAFDEDPILGGGTDAAPTFGAFYAATGTRNMKLGGVAENFSFEMQKLPAAAAPACAFFLDGCDQLEVGETAPFVFRASPNTMVKALLDNGETFAFFNGEVQPLPVVTQGLPDIAIREHADSGKVTDPTFYWARSNALPAPGGYKGVSRLYKATTASKVARNLGTKAVADDRLVLSASVTTVWNGDPVD